VCTTKTLQLYNITTLQHYNITTLQHYNTTTLQHYNTTTLQHYNTTTLQHYNTTKLQNRVIETLEGEHLYNHLKKITVRKLQIYNRKEPLRQHLYQNWQNNGNRAYHRRLPAPREAYNSN